MRSITHGAALAVAAVLALTACGGDDTADAGADAPVDDPTTEPDEDVPADGAATAELSGDLTVFAAASLTDAFEELAAAFEEGHPDLSVALNLASSSTLATQIIEGAPADVFASANQTQMDVVDDEGLVEERVPLTTNVLTMVVEAGNPFEIETLMDLAQDEVVLVLAAPEVPAGDVAAQMLDEQGIEVEPSSLEVDVRAVLSRVEFGEADAAIVYRSDVATADDTVEGVTIPDDQNVTAEYPIAVVSDAPNPDAAAAWVAFVTGPDGQSILEAAGFTSP
jgi:molybdate transport system substrate-binding protein